MRWSGLLWEMAESTALLFWYLHWQWWKRKGTNSSNSSQFGLYYQIGQAMKNEFRLLVVQYKQFKEITWGSGEKCVINQGNNLQFSQKS